MSTRSTRSIVAATFLACVFAGWGSRDALASKHKIPVTAIGCLQSEREYRRNHESNKFAGTGKGLSNEYMLINAVIGGPDLAVEPISEQEANTDCINDRGTGQSFELKGSAEPGLAGMLGRRVVVRGDLLHAKHDTGAVGTSGTFSPEPTNGGMRWGMDNKVREIQVESFALVPVAAPPEPVTYGAPEPAPPPPAVEAPQAPPAPVEPAPEPEALPKTASPLPTIGLLGLLSLIGAFGVRMLARMRPRTS